MEAKQIESLQYPIGKFQPPTAISSEMLQQYIADIAAFPKQLEVQIQALSTSLEDVAYRPAGWTVRQVIHHIADSHLNAYVRFKWTLTEDNPMIKDYDESLWVSTPEIASVPLMVSVRLIASIHERWGYLLNSMSNDQWKKTHLHPYREGAESLEVALARYVWHGKHHMAHIDLVKNSV